MDSFEIYNTLTKKEKEVMRLLALGYSIEEIAKCLTLAPSTISTHRGNIYQKLIPLIRRNYEVNRSLLSFVYWKNNLEELKNIDIDKDI